MNRQIRKKYNSMQSLWSDLDKLIALGLVEAVKDTNTGEIGYTVTEFGMKYYQELYKEQIAKLN